MSTKTFKKGVLASSIAMILAGVSSQAMAAEEAAVKKDDVEVIQVTGIRGSLKASLNGKRFSNATVDVVSSEDIGKFPDGDVGESLARIPGVSVSRQFGQGSQVSIRGASSQLTRTLLNGHSVASTGWYDQQPIDRSFNYSMLPSEMVGGLEVYKSSQADIVEGGIGGTVIVKTRRPLDLDANTVFASVKGTYGSINEEVSPEISGLYSWKNDSESFGVLVSAAVSETNYQRNGVETSRNWSGGMAPTTFQQDRERTALNLDMQFRPTDSLEFGLSLMSLDLVADNANSQLIMFPGADSCTKTNPANGNCIERTKTNNDLGYGPEGFQSGYFQTWSREASMDSNTIDFDWTYESSAFTFSGRIGNTTSDGGARTALVGEYARNSTDTFGVWDMTGDQATFDVQNKNINSGVLPDTLGIQSWAIGHNPNSDEETYLNLDFEIPVEIGVISSIKTGFRYADHSVEASGYKGFGAVTGQNGDGTNIYADTIKRTAAEYFPDTATSGGGFTIPQGDRALILADSAAYNVNNVFKKDAFVTVEEENIALYVMADFDTDGIRGNIGLRYVSTDASSSYYAPLSTPNASAPGTHYTTNDAYADVISTDTGSYSELLPSLNVAMDLSEDIILRTSAAQVISRPNYQDMFANKSLANADSTQPGTMVATTGNVALNPFKAFQADIGLEWYFSDDAMASIAYFVKDVSSFIAHGDLEKQQIGIDIPHYVDTPSDSPCGETQPDCWATSSAVNVSGGSVSGVELQLQDAFDNGLGYTLNYTYADAESPSENYSDGNAVFSDSSKHTVNAVGFYENDNFSARLAYNWRSEYMLREAPKWYYNRQHEAYGTLDFSTSWSATDYLDVTFEVANILAEDSIQTGAYKAGEAGNNSGDLELSFPSWSFEGEATYKLGVAVRF